ncbi:MAG: MnhB domain-containing protein [Pseudomonadota bacterium]
MKGHNLLVRLVIPILALVLGGTLVFAILDLAAAPVDLRGMVAARMAVSGVTHPVTAVLLNFRGYDTLLEVAVLLLALLGILAVLRPVATTPVSRPGLPVLETLAGMAVPLMVLVAGYLLWAGAHRPGGAFQAGAVLAAAGVLLHLAGRLPAWVSPPMFLRLGLGFGFLVFLTVAALLLAEGALLRYPPAHAGVLILLIESGLTLSLGLILAGLYLVLAPPPRREDGGGEESGAP